MSISRVSDLSTQNLTLSLLQRGEARTVDLQNQISTGKKSQRYEGVAAAASRLVSLEADHVKNQTFVDGIARVDSRLEKMESSVAASIDMASEFRTLLVNGLNANNQSDANIDQLANDMLDTLSGLLNARDGDRQLFAGARIDTPPVDLSTLPADGVFTGTADELYYKGDDATLSMRADESVTVDYGVKANEPGFEKLVRALQIARTTDPTDDSTAKARLESALGLVNEALAEIPDIRSRIGSARSTLETTKQKHLEVQLVTERSIDDIENVDITEAITRLSQQQATVQASFAALASLQRLSLVNFIG